MQPFRNWMVLLDRSAILRGLGYHSNMRSSEPQLSKIDAQCTPWLDVDLKRRFILRYLQKRKYDHSITVHYLQLSNTLSFVRNNCVEVTSHVLSLKALGFVSSLWLICKAKVYVLQKINRNDLLGKINSNFNVCKSSQNLYHKSVENSIK